MKWLLLTIIFTTGNGVSFNIVPEIFEDETSCIIFGRVLSYLEDSPMKFTCIQEWSV